MKFSEYSIMLMSNNLYEHAHEHMFMKKVENLALLVSILFNEHAHEHCSFEKSHEQHNLG